MLYYGLVTGNGKERKGVGETPSEAAGRGIYVEPVARATNTTNVGDKNDEGDAMVPGVRLLMM